MRKILIGGAAALLAGCAMNDGGPQSATAEGRVPLVAADGSPRGTVRIAQVQGGVSIEVIGENLPPGVHGAHVHAIGQCSPPDFASAGPHWNPTTRQHGTQNPAGPHLGDVPNLNVGPDGRGTLSFVLPGASVRSGGPRMLDADGVAFVIHAAADDYRTDPSGNSGGRIACAVLR